MDKNIKETQKAYKRPFDVTILVLAHVLLLPIWTVLWVVIPVLIWLEDRGPVFYLQERVGLGGRIFGLLKFRSMNVRNVTKPCHDQARVGASVQSPRQTYSARPSRRVEVISKRFLDLGRWKPHSTTLTGAGYL